jgi:L-alanine-DL-glutamate epimerase-like enolase superfamily enzyme
VYSPGEELEWVGGVIQSWDAALIEVTLSDGTVGVGEVGAGIMAAAAVPGIVDSFRPYLVMGQAFDTPLAVGAHLREFTAFWSRGGMLNGTAGAIELACVDAVAKREGVPAYEVLGGLRRERIEAYASGGLGTTFEHVLEWATMQADSGFSTVKFRAMRDPQTTISLLDFVVPRLPRGTQFILDAVQGCAANPWGLEDAIVVGQAAARLGARWYEEPRHADDAEGYASVRDALTIPISGVESNGTVLEFERLLRAGSVDIVQPDATFVGGAAAFADVASRAHETGVRCVPHVWGSGVTFAANLHVALASPFVELFEYCTLPNPLRGALLSEPIRQSGTELLAPTAPGFGVALTPEIEARYPFMAGGGHRIR